jgi:hypothetical protein
MMLRDWAKHQTLLPYLLPRCGRGSGSWFATRSKDPLLCMAIPPSNRAG